MSDFLLFWKIFDPFVLQPLVGFEHLGAEQFSPNYAIYFVDLPDSVNNTVYFTPQVVCKYIENPVLFHREGIGRMKFDVRYLVLISSAKPLVLHADRVFWLRFANQ